MREYQHIDFKEEAGRRQGSDILTGTPKNPEAATKLADEVSCMANTPGGGVLIVGVDGHTGAIIGTELHIDWLRSRICHAVDVAPDIVQETVEGQRLLVIYVAEAPEPVQDTLDRLRWRVGDRCEPVDRSEWWQHLRQQRNYDVMAQVTDLDVKYVRSQATHFVRESRKDLDVLTDRELLIQLGAVSSQEFLTRAGQLLFVSAGKTLIDLSIFDVPGGQILKRISGSPEMSLLEQLDQIERALTIEDKDATVSVGLADRMIPQIPFSAVRESLLNGVIHRDWNRSEPTEVRWFDVDSMLVARSPGGFPGAITSKNVLSNRSARYPALADLFRAIGLVDKQGVGVDRMYQAMIALGHRPPVIKVRS
ncbi:MAG: ATP-binding protein [Actinomycetaceae bacterium]|nr:ATP-binding protein [Actinomycetaceae bacterium]MDY6082255.1 ATP-binding protein [Actinomycetaceae bacterium]